MSTELAPGPEAPPSSRPLQRDASRRLAGLVILGVTAAGLVILAGEAPRALQWTGLQLGFRRYCPLEGHASG